jgi:hypothetical protein
MIKEKITRVDDLRTKITPAIIIDINTLRDVSIWQLTQSTKNLEYFENIFKEVVNFKWGNRSQFFSNSTGMLFKFRLTQTDIQVWDCNGKMIFEAGFPDRFNGAKKFDTDRPNYDAVLPLEIYNKMNEACSDYVRGMIACSKCETKILKTAVAGHFYAGSYCSDCWENGVKQQEARENYD